MKSNFLYWGVFTTFLLAGMLFDIFGPSGSYVDYSLDGVFSVPIYPHISIPVPNVNGFSDPFPFANIPLMGAKWYFYYAIEHYTLCATFFLLWKATGNDVVRLFFWVQVVDLIDYLLFYNEAYFFIGGFPVSYNIISFIAWVVLGFYLVYKLILSYAR